MKIKNKEFQDKIAKALGASRSVVVSDKKYGTPLGWIEQANRLQERLVSRGGRPSDPHWEVKRLVPFTKENWESLTIISEKLSSGERKIGPAQLSAMLIEKQLDAFTIVNGTPSISVNLKTPSSDWLLVENNSGNQNFNVVMRFTSPSKTIPALPQNNDHPQAAMSIRGTENLIRMGQLT